jgi:dTMP kinase
MARAESRGLFVTLEGVDGAGKSTQLDKVAQHLRRAGREVVVTREPGGTPFAERLRALILAEAIEPTCETLLLFAARADHVARLIRPALERSACVVCDRFTDATLAYQGGGKGVAAEAIRSLAAISHPGLEPDLTLVFDCPYEVSRARLAAAGRAQDRFEREDRPFFERVRSAYLRLGKAHPGRIRLIDGSRTLSEVEKQVEDAITGI